MNAHSLRPRGPTAGHHECGCAAHMHGDVWPDDDSPPTGRARQCGACAVTWYRRRVAGNQALDVLALRALFQVDPSDVFTHVDLLAQLRDHPRLP